MSERAKSTRRKAKVVIEQRVGPWQVALAWPDDADQGGPVAISIKPYADVGDDELIGGLSSTALRRIDFRAAREKWVEARAKYLDLQDGMEQLRAEQLRRILDRDGVTDTYLAYLANAYVQMVRAGERSVAGKLAEMTGRSPDTMKQHLHRVRKEKMLTAISGKAGGQLTEKALDTIRAASRQHASRDGFAPQDSSTATPKVRELASNLTSNSATSAVDKDAEIERLKSDLETWRRLATDLAEYVDKSADDQSPKQSARATT